MPFATILRRVFRSETTKTRLTFILLLLLLFVLACKCGKLGESGNSNNDNNSNNSNDNDNKRGNNNLGSDRQGNATAEDDGDFVVSYEEVQNPDYRALDANFRRERVLEDAAMQLNDALTLPTDITLTTRDCGNVNAFYQPGTKTLTICYELMDHFYTLFRKQGMSDERAGKEMKNAITFVFFHELGHALIDVYKLGVSGGEEDAADQLATYVSTEELNDDEAAIAGAKAFALESQSIAKGQSKDLPFYDEHSLGPQRFFNIICGLYGHNPEKYQKIVDDGTLPQSRAVRCADEYEKFSTYWKNQLKPYRKN